MPIQVSVKFPKIIRRFSECGPFLVQNCFQCAYKIHQSVEAAEVLKASLVALISVDRPGQLTPQLIEYYFNISADFVVILADAGVDAENIRRYTFVKENCRVAIASRSGDGTADFDLCISQLAQKYCRGKWVIICNQYEYLTYPYHETRSLKDLLSYQDSLSEKSLGALTVDCFANETLETSIVTPKSFQETEAHFISRGYSLSRDHANDTYSCSVLHRKAILSFDLRRDIASTAVVKWRSHYSTSGNGRRVIPRQRNHVFGSSKVHLVLLSFEFWFKSDKFQSLPMDQLQRIKSSSTPLGHWSCLAEHGLLNLGEWSL